MEANPYRPPVQVESITDDQIPLQAEFRVTGGGLKHGLQYCLLYTHPYRLLIGSVLIIVASTALVGITMVWYPLALLPVVLLNMGAATIIYMALVRRSETQIRRTVAARGLRQDEIASVRCTDDGLYLVTGQSERRWGKHEITLRRTPKGLLVLPEPMFYVFVPRQASCRPGPFRRFRSGLELWLRSSAA